MVTMQEQCKSSEYLTLEPQKTTTSIRLTELVVSHIKPLPFNVVS